MKQKKKIVWYSIAAIIVIMQLYPYPKPEVTTDNPGDLLKTVEVPDNVSTILKSACYDCHSNESSYPWYSYVAPVKWFVYDHIEEGREDVNFSIWDSYSKSDKAEILDDISSEVSEGDMPLKPYPLTHPRAKLTEKQREILVDWADDYTERLFE